MLVCALLWLAHAHRLGGSEVAGSDPLAVPATEDPLTCLLDQPGGAADMSMVNPRALDYLDHRLMVTDDVRSVLAVLAPWLVSQHPFLLVSRVSGVLLQQQCLLFSPFTINCYMFAETAERTTSCSPQDKLSWAR